MQNYKLLSIMALNASFCFLISFLLRNDMLNLILGIIWMLISAISFIKIIIELKKQKGKNG